ncbi:MAG: sensor histidine kinase [Acidobacteria bacterium]|nr:sensor histidine kinase [Acidobacteriota bacterium]
MMAKPELSDSDIEIIAGFARKVTKAPVVDKIVAEVFDTLKAVAGTHTVRVVYSPRPSTWKEWKASLNSIEEREHDEWPAPVKKELTVMFDSDMDRSGYVSVERKPVGRRKEREARRIKRRPSEETNGKIRLALSLLAPEIWAALLLESALRRAQRASISETELVRETLRARDEERRHIARELHDDIGQSMASLKLALKWAEDAARPQPGLTEDVKEIAAARESVGTTLNKIRDLSHTLYPRILDSLGLVSAIKELAHQASRHASIQIESSTRGTEQPLNKDVSTALYRCCQEAISNAIRHAEATTLKVNVHYNASEVRLSVEDDGKGFDPRALYDSNSKLMTTGFWTIRQRMADLGGAFRVSTAAGRGTVVEMIVPYPKRIYARGKDKTTHRG